MLNLFLLSDLLDEIEEIQNNIGLVQEKGEGLVTPGDTTSQDAMFATVRELMDKAQKLEEDAKVKLKQLEVGLIKILFETKWVFFRQVTFPLGSEVSCLSAIQCRTREANLARNASLVLRESLVPNVIQAPMYYGLLES